MWPLGMLQSCPNLPSLNLRNLLEVGCQALTVPAWVWALVPAVHRCVAAVPCTAIALLQGSSMELLLIYRESDINTEPQVP